MNILILFYFIFSPIHGLNVTPIVNLISGPIQGSITEYESTNVYQFLGVPYAQPPIGKLRFQLPVEHEPWTEVKSATNFGPACLQSSPQVKIVSEDCLYLNIYVTESTFSNSSVKLRPVLVWIHGGGFTVGSGNLDSTGIPMVPLHDVILVTFNYRLGVFGFIYFGSGEPQIPANIGLKDQIFVLKWIRENIHKFGGDPNSITIFGVSAGAISASALLVSPLSKGFFKRAILESGSFYVGYREANRLISDSLKLYNKTSCSGMNNILECMQNITATEIMNVMNNDKLQFIFTFGDDFLPYKPDKVFSEGLFENSADILLGAEKNEATYFMHAIDPITFDFSGLKPITYQEAINYLRILVDSESIDYFRELYLGPETNNSDYLTTQFEKAYTDISQVCPTYMFGHLYASSLGKSGGKVYAYYHTQRLISNVSSTPEWMGVVHGAEVPLVFGLPLTIAGYSQEDIALSREVMKIWTYFAENGETPMIGETRWKPIQESLSAMILNMDDWGKTETERLEFCHKEWAYMWPHIERKDY